MSDFTTPSPAIVAQIYWSKLRRSLLALCLAGVFELSACRVAGADGILESLDRFPLPPLTKELREERLNDFLTLYNISFVKAENTSTEDSCNKIISVLQSPSKNSHVEVLAPQFLAKDTQGYKSSHVSKQCPKINLERLVLPGFLKDINDKNSYLFYFAASANIELYDLKRFFDRNYWGYFAEGTLPVCPSAEAAPVCREYLGYGSNIGRVFDLDKCEVVFDEYFKYTRLHTSFTRPYKEIDNTPNKNIKISYTENKSVGAFLRIDKEIYRIKFNPPSPLIEGVMSLDRIDVQPKNWDSCVYKATFK